MPSLRTVRLGGDWEGWDTARVEQERTFLMEKLARGEWAPAAPDPKPAPSAALLPARGVRVAAAPGRQGW